MPRTIVYTYKHNNNSARRIAEALGAEYHYPESGYRYQVGDFIINWGNGHRMGVPQDARILNKYTSIFKSVNKETTFEYLQDYGVSIPKRTKLRDIAANWIDQGHIVFCRQELEGHNGAGIVVARTKDQLVQAPLYTQYFETEHEYRVHVFKDDAIFVTEKGIASDAGPNPDPMVKSGNDWSMNWVDPRAVPSSVKYEAILATKAVGLDFGAIDIGFHGADNETVVFETNTAPGGFGPVTLRKYVEAFRREING